MSAAVAGTTMACQVEADRVVERRASAALAAVVSALGLLAGCSAAPSAPATAAGPARPSAPATPTTRTPPGGFAPLDRPGPPLRVPGRALAASLRCSAGLRHATREPVLLSPGTGVTPAEEFSWTYERRFTAQHRPWCAVTMPDRTQGDIQVAAEYLVHAIRTMHRQAHRRIAIVGHSQGGMSMRWALRFWPGTRPMVADVIGLAGDNAGTTTFTSCRVGHPTCTPAIWQQIAGSRFLTALNSRAETFAGIAYTEIFTHTDEVVQPSQPDARASSALHTGGGAIANIAIQSVCPRDISEHLEIGTTDPVAAALVNDALDHPGPAVPGRIPRVVCLERIAPDIAPRVARVRLRELAHGPGISSAADVRREPPLACYVYAAGCPGR